jgi:hypothetical protein
MENRVKRRRKPRLRDISVVRAELFDHWFATGEKDLNGLFLPYIMLDIMQVHANEHLAKMDLIHKERQHYNKLMELYHTFNINFFSRLSQEPTNRIIDMMDSFSEYIHNEMEIFRMQIIGCIMDLSEDYRAACGWICVCKLLISQSVIAWKGMYKNTLKNTDPFFKLICGMEKHISELMNHFFLREQYRLHQDVQFSTVNTVRLAEENVIKKILKFIKEYDNS